VTPKLNVGTGKIGYTRTRRTRDLLTRTRPVPDPTRDTPTRPVPHPYPTRGYGSGTGKPVGTGIPADL